MTEHQQHAAQANIGVIGLAVMGSNLARNLASREGNTVAVYNRTYARTEELITEHGDAGFIASEDIDDFVASLSKPRTAIIMVQAGKGTDAVISQLADKFEEGDIIVDGGNANFHDTIRREHDLREKGLNFVGTGISGGEEGALKGPSIMPGGSKEAWETLGPILKSIAAVAEGEPCVTHIGTDGAGHFVKMVHNGIEYADMQLIAESYDLLRRVGGLSVDDLVGVFQEWNGGDLESYLIEITVEVLKQRDADSGKFLVDVIRDEAGSKGTGVWTVQNAVGLGIPVSGIGEAVFARAVSSKPSQRAAVQQAFPDRPDIAEVPDGFEDDVRAALYASKVVAYAQGFDLIIAGAKEYGWDIDLGNVAKIWRGGCIIRAQFLNRIVEAYDKNPSLESLLVDPYFANAVHEGEAAWRRIVGIAAASGIPAPGFSSALSYFDSLASERLPASLIQGQRDFFGAHTYQRIDKDGTFHTLWSDDDRREVDQEPSTH
ncbi:NADP-dependent phosphogluconate dehydrogenase [Curtobacterium sp. VKM Ac-1393]|uniref:NADP-dependent phosphogluconate dehydrogenase n=1 Tax=Curtobacterium sp. VKM Ac-1393 TaxID=2783814 RepID=UPI00188B2BB8|nr:NADP-dependent phosphogluconate dehydrogenase [Curtobacterium sp. VKM Ac-1393]MBF4609445.1 NADP-dependent phosphogluconate dehydrogenase [Curtobacterium sp. VKM Ac-1393]